MTCGISRGEWALLDMRQRLKVAAVSHVSPFVTRRVRAWPPWWWWDAAEEVSKRPDAPKAHSAAAYCAALQRACNPSAELAAAVGKFVAGDAP